jgi:hypothetical protein
MGMAKSSISYACHPCGATLLTIPAIHPLSTSQGEGGSRHSSKRILGKALESLEHRPARVANRTSAATALSTAYLRA